MKDNLEPKLKDYYSGNVILAKFMGMKQGHPDPNEERWKNDWWELNTFEHELAYGRRQSVLKFHFDYNWLMPVIMKLKTVATPGQMNIINQLLYKKGGYEELYFFVVDVVKSLDNEAGESTYTVRWEMSFEAKDAQHAAALALETMRDEDSIATCFTVRHDTDDPTYFIVDLYEETIELIAKKDF